MAEQISTSKTGIQIKSAEAGCQPSEDVNADRTATGVADRATMRNNGKAFGVCVFESYEVMQSYIEVDGMRAMDFSENQFACDVWFYPQQQSYSLLTQPNGFSLGVRDGKLVFTFGDGRCVSAIVDDPEHSLPEIALHSWNNVFASYDGSTISFYLQGSLIYSEKVGPHSVVSRQDECYKIGESFTGYMRSVRIYNKAMPNTEKDNGVGRYICQSVYEKSSMHELIAWVDFGKEEIQNLSGLSLEFSVHNICYTDNSIQAISVAGDDYAYAANTTLNPVATENHQHAIYVKFFTQHSNADKQVLLSNGDFQDDDALILYLQTQREVESPQDAAFLLCMQIGKQTIQVSSKAGYINGYTWNDLLVTFLAVDGRISAYFYLNGRMYGSAELAGPYLGRKGNGDVKIGNAFEISNGSSEAKANPFGGYITTVAVFDQQLIHQINNSFVDTKKPLEFHENEPFIYEPGIIALYDVDENDPVELISGLKIVMHNDAMRSPRDIRGLSKWLGVQQECSIIGCVIGTNNPNIETQAYMPYLPSPEDVAKQSSLSNRDQKLLNQLGGMLSECFATVSGVTIPENEMKLFSYSSGEQFLSSKLMSDIKSGNALNVDGIINFFGGITIRSLATLGVVLNAVGGQSLKLLLKAMLAYFSRYAKLFLFIALLVLAITLIIYNWPDPDPDGNDDIIVQYDAISFSGLASLDVSYAGQIYVGEPTWQPRCGMQGNPSVFMIDKLAGGITMNVSCQLKPIGKEAPKIANVTIEAVARTPYGNLFTKFSGSKIDCKVGAMNTIPLKSVGCVLHPLAFNNLYNYSTTYVLTSRINGKNRDSIVITLPMYSIPGTPLKPIGSGKQNAVIVEFIDMLSTSATSAATSADAQTVAMNSTATDDSKTFRTINEEVQNMMNNLFENKFIQYDPNATTLRISVKEFQIEILDIKEMQARLYEAKQQISPKPARMKCTHFALVLTYGISLLPKWWEKSLQPYLMSFNYDESESEREMESAELFCSGKYHGGCVNGVWVSQPAKKYNFIFHFITTYILQNQQQFADPSCRIQQNEPPIYQNFGQYLDEVFPNTEYSLDIKYKAFIGGNVVILKLILK